MKLQHPIRLISFFLLGLFTLLLIGFFALQTTLGSSFLEKKLQEAAAEKNIELSIEKIEASFPFSYTITNAHIKTPSSDEIRIEKLTFRITLYNLIQRKLTIPSLYIKNLYYAKGSTKERFTEKTQSPPPSPATSELTSSPASLPPQKVQSEKEKSSLWPTPDLGIDIQLLTLDGLHLNIENTPLVIDVTGKARLKRKGKEFTLDLTFTRERYEKTELHLFMKGKKKSDEVYTSLEAKGDSFAFLSPWIKPEIDNSFSVEMKLSGPLDNYVSFLSESSLDTDVSKKEKAPTAMDPNSGFSKEKILGSIKASFLPDKNSMKALPVIFQDKWHFFSSFHLFQDGSMTLPYHQLKNRFISLVGSSKFSPGAIWNQTELSLTVDQLLSSSLKGKFEIIRKENIPTYKGEFDFEKALIGPYLLSKGKGSVNGKFDQKLEGGFTLSSILLDELFTSKGSYIYDSDLHLKNVSLSSPYYQLQADLSLLKDSYVKGNVQASLKKLDILSAFFPEKDLLGKAEIKANFDTRILEEKPFQTVSIDLNLIDYFVHEIQGKEAKISLLLTDPFSDPFGTVEIQGKKASYQDLFLETFTFQTALNRDKSPAPFSLKMEGEEKTPLKLAAGGNWQYKDESIDIHLSDLKGHVLEKKLFLQKPTEIEWNSNTNLSIHDLALQVGAGKIIADINLAKATSNIKGDITDFPIEILNLFLQKYSLQGLLDLHLDYQSEDLGSGTFLLALKEGKISELGAKKPVLTDIKLSGNMHSGRFISKGIVLFNKKEQLEIDMDLPLLISLFPFSYRIDPEKALTMELLFQGKIEHILEYIPIPGSRLTGDAQARLVAKGSIKKPDYSLSFQLKQGGYENYDLGLLLKNVAVEVESKENSLLLHSLTADGIKSGSLKALGKINLKKEKKKDFSIQLELHDIDCMDSDLYSFVADGNILFQGDEEKGLASGKIEIKKGEINIPDKIPQMLPPIAVTFLNKPSSDPIVLSEPKKHYQLDFDIDVYAPKKIFIKGKGLFSEWKGDMNIKGSYPDLILTGGLHLVKGDFSFSGRSFTLSEGSLIFPGVKKALPQLTLAAQTTVQGNIITASLKGPINAPALSFSSQPALPLSNIMSLLLFNQNVSDINGLQALQLANSISNLSQGPSLSDKAARSLGVDRFALVSTPTNTDEDPNKFGVQVGKYVAEGVMVSVSQGMEQGSSNLIVDVDLGGGFVFQAETQQEEEQGKFSVKWNKSY